MKKLYTLSIILLASLSFGQQSIPFSDNFSYPTGSLNDTAPWSILGAVSTIDNIALNGSKVTFGGGGTDAQLLITPQTTGTVYYKYTLNITSMAGVTDANGGYLTGFTQNGTTFGGTLWAKRVDDNSFNLGIEVRTANATNTTYSTSVYQVNTPLTIVVGYTFSSGTTSDDTVVLYVNPTSSSATPTLTDSHAGTDLASIVSFFIRQDSLTETGLVEIDDLVVSTDINNVLSVKSQNTIVGLKVYTYNNNLYVTSDSTEAKSVLVYNLLGKQVVNTKVNNQAINVADLSSGIYIVKVTENGKTNTVKVVLQ